MIKNKFQVTYLKPKEKTFIGARKIRNVVGNNVDKFKIRHAFVDYNGKIDSQRCLTLEQAKKQFLKFNIKNIAKAVFYDNNGNEHTIYEKKDEPKVEK